jgi:hypothetical protein
MPPWRGKVQFTFTFTAFNLFTLCYIFLCAFCNKNITGSLLTSKITFVLSCRRGMCNTLAHCQRQTKYSFLQYPLNAVVRRKVVQDSTSPNFHAINQSAGIPVGSYRVLALPLMLMSYQWTETSCFFFKINVMSFQISQACSVNNSRTRIEEFIVKHFVESSIQSFVYLFSMPVDALCACLYCHSNSKVPTTSYHSVIITSK